MPVDVTLSSPPLDSKVVALLLQEYQSLREEMTKRIELRQRILDLTIISAGAILALEASIITMDRILIIYPVLVMFFAAGWVHQGMFLMKLGSYLREIVEPALTGMETITVVGSVDDEMLREQRRIGYESDLERFSPRRQKYLGHLSSTGLFISVQALSLLMGIMESERDAVDYLIILVSFASIAATMVLLNWRTLPVPKGAEKVQATLVNSGTVMPE